jgi:hypothetical protein
MGGEGPVQDEEPRIQEIAPEEPKTDKPTDGKPTEDKPTEDRPEVDIDAEADPTVEGHPSVEAVDLSRATYQDETYPSFAMGSIYTYVLVEEGDEEEPRVQAGNLDDFPEREEAYDTHSYVNVLTVFQYFRNLASRRGMTHPDTWLAIESDLQMLALGVDIEDNDLVLLMQRIESLVQAERAEWDKNNPKKDEPKRDEPKNLPPIREDLGALTVPLGRIQGRLADPSIAMSLAELFEALTVYDLALRNPETTVSDVVEAFRPVIRAVDHSFAGAHFMVGHIEDPAERLAALVDIFQFITTDLYNVRRRIAHHVHGLGVNQNKGPGPLRVDHPGNRPELHSSVIEDLGPKGAKKNSDLKLPIPYPRHDEKGKFHDVGHLGKGEDKTLLDLSRDGGTFVKPQKKPDDKSVREGLTGLHAMKKHPVYKRVVRGPERIEFFDDRGNPWDVKTPPSYSRNDKLIAETIDSITKKLFRTHSTYDFKTDDLTDKRELVSILLDVTYLDEWDWMNLWFEMGSNYEQKDLVRIYELVVDYDPPTAPSQTGRSTNETKNEDKESARGNKKNQPPSRQGPQKHNKWAKPQDKPEPVKGRGKGGPQDTKKEKEQESNDSRHDQKCDVTKVYPNIRFLEGARTGAFSAGGPIGLPIPCIDEGAVAPSDIANAITDVLMTLSRSTYSNHRGFLPIAGVYLEYNVSATPLPHKTDARLVWNPRTQELYITGTHYEPWYETWPGYAWRSGFYRIALSEKTRAEIATRWGGDDKGTDDKEKKGDKKDDKRKDDKHKK